jgi:hypothetical protein
MTMTGKPTAQTLGLDPSSLTWRRAGAAASAGPGAAAGPGTAASAGPGAMEVAVAPRGGGGKWVLLRVADDPDGRVLVYDEHEWACFLDGVRNGEFDLSG